MDPTRSANLVVLLGRLLIGGVYLQAGISNLLYQPGKAGYAASKGLIAADVLVVVAGALLIGAGLSFLLGVRPELGVLAITLFLIPVTGLMHNFWAYDGLPREIESHAFLGNVALLGSALLFLAIPRPWPLSLDAWIAARAGAPRRPPAEMDPALRPAAPPLVD
jgi:putative oxidoreductase